MPDNRHFHSFENLAPGFASNGSESCGLVCAHDSRPPASLSLPRWLFNLGIPHALRVNRKCTSPRGFSPRRGRLRAKPPRRPTGTSRRGLEGSPRRGSPAQRPRVSPQRPPFRPAARRPRPCSHRPAVSRRRHFSETPVRARRRRVRRQPSRSCPKAETPGRRR